MPVSNNTTIRHTMNPIPNPPAAKLPTAKQLKTVLGNWEFHSKTKPNGGWSTRKPAGLTKDNTLKTYVVSKPPKGMAGGATVTAYVLKDQPNMVIYQRNRAVAPPNNVQYFGPVRNDISPR